MLYIFPCWSPQVKGGGDSVWALTSDNHVYTLCDNIHNNNNPITDVVCDYLWENQRWNPITGLT